MSGVAYAQIIDTLEIETDIEIWKQLFSTMINDGREFVMSSSRAFKLILGPMLRLIIISAKALSPHIESAIQDVYAWQMRQPNEVLALELFSFLLLLLLYALKRFITRNRYVERLKGWGGKKRAEVGEKWNDFMDRVGRVNSTLGETGGRSQGRLMLFCSIR